MAATFMTIRYGPRLIFSSPRLRVYDFQPPLWLLAGAPQRMQRERMQRAPLRDGSYIRALGSDPVTLEMPLLLRPTEGPTGTTAQGELNKLRALRGQPLHLYLGPEDWGDGWWLERLSERYETFNLPPDEGATKKGGVRLTVARVAMSLERGVSDVSPPSVTV